MGLSSPQSEDPRQSLLAETGTVVASLNQHCEAGVRTAGRLHELREELGRLGVEVTFNLPPVQMQALNESSQIPTQAKAVHITSDRIGG